LEEYWTNVGFIYPDEKPHRLLTAMVLYACVKLAEKNNSYASMLALNVVDIWPYLSVHNPHLILSKELVDEWNKKLNIYSYSTYTESVDIKGLKIKLLSLKFFKLTVKLKFLLKKLRRILQIHLKN
jgi:hypothetical protein